MRVIPVMTVVVVNLGEKRTTWPVDAAAKGAHKCPPVLVAKGAVKQEIAGGVDGH